MNHPRPLTVTGLSKRYGPTTVLSGIELGVDSGETVVLTGPNGTGKSTLLGCICGTVIADEGRVEIGEHDLRTEPLAARRGLRYLPQEVEVPSGLSGLELLEFFADVHGGRNDMDRAIAFSDLGDALQRFATTYSVGMRRRLMFAALLFGPARLFVLDEPFAGVDAAGRIRMLEVLHEELAKGAGIIVAAHDQDAREVEALNARRLDLAHPPAPPPSEVS